METEEIKKIEEYKKKVEDSELLKKYNLNRLGKQSKFFKILGIFGLIILLINASFFIYLVNNGKLQSVYELSVDPNFNASIFNSYDFKPVTNVNNQYSSPNNNFTIYVNNILPDLCNNG